MFGDVSYFLGILFILTIMYGYIKYKYGFWVIQPVFHIYDVGYMFSLPRIISPSLPEKNKYTNFSNIDTYTYSEMPTFKINRLIHLINNNYFREKQNFFRLRDCDFTPYFKCHNAKAFISIYSEKQNLQSNDKIIKENKMISVITSRPLTVMINNTTQKMQFDCYYVDYLCVSSAQRKNGIAPQMIQTHHYNQRHKNKNISVSLFKREDELTGIIPLCVYSTYGFSVDKWSKPKNPLVGKYVLLEINTHNIHTLVDFIKESSNMFDVIIDCQNLAHLIDVKSVFVYAMLCESHIIGAFFFRKTSIFVNTTLEVLSCFASINKCPSNDLFIASFKHIFWKIASDHFFGYCSVENISHNDVVIENLCLKSKPEVISPTAYFWYNFVYTTTPANKVLIIT